MARKAREISKSGNYYITLKGNELFVTDEDKKMFVEILEKNFATGIVHGYYLTKSEIRLVVKEGEKGISMTMKPVTTSYARYFNRTHEREGKLFADRFKSEPLETDEEIEECIKTQTAGKEIIDLQLLKETIQSFLDSLSKEERCIFIERYYYYMDPVTEIARHHAFSVSKTKSILYRIRNKLRQHLIKEGYDL